MIKYAVKGDFNKTENFLKNVQKLNLQKQLDKYGRKGVEALASSTPKDTGNTADSWNYEIEGSSDGISITWNNSNVNNGVNIAVILQYGHGTGTGGYVQGRDYINPALQPVFDEIVDAAWGEVTRL